MVATAAEAVERAEAESAHPTRDYTGLCLQATRTFLRIPRKYASARLAWLATDEDDQVIGGVKVLRVAPKGVPLYWQIGKHWHVGLSNGDGRFWSNDLKRRGRIDLVGVDAPRAQWGAKPLGYALTLNGVRLRTPGRQGPTDWVRVRVEAGDTVIGLLSGRLAPGQTWRDVWEDERNASLRATRQVPERIRPGDSVWVPGR